MYHCFCGLGFTNQTTIGSHLRRLHKCGDCSYIVPTAAIFREHVALQHRLEGGNVAQIQVEVEEELSEQSCPVCGFVSGAVSGLNRRHILKRHQERCYRDEEEASLEEEGKIGGVRDGKEADGEMEQQEEVEEEAYDGDEEVDDSGVASWMTVLCKKPGITIMSPSVRPPGN